MESSINFEFDSLEYKIAIDYFNCSLNNSINDPDKKEMWLKILQLFFYSNKIDNEIILINKVLNYLYTGKLGDGDFTSKDDDLLIDPKKKTKIIGHFQKKPNIDNLIKKKTFFLELYALYLGILHTYFSSSGTNKTYGKILIYEAPPFKEDENVVDHFLLTGDKYLNAIIEADSGEQNVFKIDPKLIEDFINNNVRYSINFKRTDVFPDEIREGFYLFNKESLKNDKKEKNREEFIKKLETDYNNKKFTEIANLVVKIRTYSEDFIRDVPRDRKKIRFKIEEKKYWTSFLNELKTYELLVNLEKAVASEIAYIDLILAPIHIDSELRKAWSSKDEFLFDDKTLPVLLFEWAIEHFKHAIRVLKKDQQKEQQLLSTNCLIAMGTPLNTSISIYEHFADKMFLIDTYVQKSQRKENYIDLTQLNSPVAFRKFENRGRGVLFPMFKSNVIGGNRYPDSMLVKHAFDIPDKVKS